MVATLIIGGIALVFLLPALLAFLESRKTPEQTAAEKLEQKKRDEKGAIGNTIDFLFGEGAFDKPLTKFENSSKQQMLVDTIDGKPVKTTKQLTDEGFITATRPITLSQLGKNQTSTFAILEKNQAQKLKRRRF